MLVADRSPGRLLARDGPATQSMASVAIFAHSGGGERRGQARWPSHPVVAASLSVLAVCAGYYLAAVISLIARFPSSGISTIWLATPILLAALLIVPSRSWWLYCLALLPVHIHLVLTFQGPVPLPVMLIQLGGNCAHAVLAAAVLRRLLGVPPRLVGLRNMALFILVACVATPWLVSALVVFIFEQLGWTPDFWPSWRGRSLSSGGGALVAVPLILWVITGGIRGVRNAPLRRHVEFAVLAVALVVVGLIVFGESFPGRSPALLYAPLPILLWTAVRFGFGGLCVALAAVAVASFSNAIAGRGPFIHQSPVENALALQLFLFVVVTPLVLLSAVAQEQRETFDAARRAEAALRAGYAQIRDLAGRLITAQEAERKRIARDLHDDLSQKLTLLSLDIGQLVQHAPASDDLAASVQRVSERASEIAANVHSLSYQLHPSRLEILGLVTAIHGICRDVSAQNGLTVDFEHRDVPETVKPEVALCLYRIVQEGLHNVVKHSRAREAHVSLARHDGVLDLRIADRGVGFAADDTAHAGIGLISMRERVSLVGGTIAIDSTPGAGTRIAISVPITANHDDGPGGIGASREQTL
jgi:signal transduction histidine kinase